MDNSKLALLISATMYFWASYFVFYHIVGKFIFKLIKKHKEKNKINEKK